MAHRSPTPPELEVPSDPAPAYSEPRGAALLNEVLSKAHTREPETTTIATTTVTEEPEKTTTTTTVTTVITKPSPVTNQGEDVKLTTLAPPATDLEAQKEKKKEDSGLSGWRLLLIIAFGMLGYLAMGITVRYKLDWGDREVTEGVSSA
jgi:hypothetical protein